MITDSIKACWDEVKKCSSMNDIQILIDSFPEELGEWEACKSIIADNTALVTVIYYDKEKKQDVREHAYITVDDLEVKPDLVIYEEDIDYFDDEEEIMYIPKRIFRTKHLNEDSLLKIKVLDSESADAPVYLYSLIDETSTTVGLQRIGTAS